RPDGREPTFAPYLFRTPEMIESRPAAVSAPKIVEKPWGREIWYAHEDRYAGKILEVTKGHALSLQKHERKQETMYLQSGRVLYHLNGEDFEMVPGDCLTVRPGDVHRMTALEDAVMLEVSTPELDDVIRLEDRYGRS
ncbi:MAG TPA: cupin domain-containing protein, partial [Longimicrobiaceae bacterium]|nr:cupin domain-containing protein [Longimicrobiaceae bacterium]